MNVSELGELFALLDVVYEALDAGSFTEKIFNMWKSGKSIEEIVDDYGLTKLVIIHCLRKFDTDEELNNLYEVELERYRRYLKSKEYNKEKKDNASKSSRNFKSIVKILEGRCSSCGTQNNLQIHHISYNPEIFTILCIDCHVKEHGHWVGLPQSTTRTD